MTIKLWVVTGDCHGDMSRFENYNYPRDGSTGIIILGDAGVNYYLNNRDTSAKKKLQNSGYQFYLVRGNHEQRPELCENITWGYNEDVKGCVGIDKAFPAIHYFIDGDVYNINNHSVLVIGGAYSIDKYYRLQKGYPYQWFEKEQLDTNEREIIYNKIKGVEFDFVLTHTCPRSFEPTDLFISGINQTTVDKSMEDWLEKVKLVIKYKVWLFGHFHADRIEKRNVEQYYRCNDLLEDIWQRWTKLKEPEWWIQKSPKYYFKDVED